MKIKKLKLYTTRLSAQRDFYQKILGLLIIKETENEVHFHIGNSILIFEQKAQAIPYHVAINIPANQENEALEWLKSRVNILKYAEKEVQDFTNWNAKAMYFYDPDKNIMELIARKDLPNTSEQIFDQNAFLEISEIGMPVTDINPIFKLLHEQCGLEVYDGNFDRFCAIGHETGLFICINKLEKDYWFPTEDKALSSDFEVEIQVGGKVYPLRFEKEKLHVL